MECKKWKIKRSLSKEIVDWFNDTYLKDSKSKYCYGESWLYSEPINGGPFPHSSPINFKDFTEITLEQFKQFVLKEPVMKKKIIGYKAPIDLFGGDVKKDTIYKPTSSHPTPQPKFCPVDDSNKPICGFSYDLPKEIVETWEPVYEEEYKVGDWVYIIQARIGATGANDRVGMIVNEEGTAGISCDHPSGIKVKIGQAVWTIGKNFSDVLLRKATFEEIEVAQVPDITINGYEAKFFNNYVKFGCAKIDNNIFTTLVHQGFLNTFDFSNRQIQSITIGKGVFSKEAIKQIAEYINRNKA